MQNFVERWSLLTSKCSPEKLAKINKDEYVLDPYVSENEGGLWNMQLFRSITSDSCKFDEQRYSKLHSKGNRLVERSIQECMVRQIRKAQRFIYMENQYFLGSANSWKDNFDTLAHRRRKYGRCSTNSLRPISYFGRIWELYVLDLKIKVFCRKEKQLLFPMDKGLTVPK